MQHDSLTPVDKIRAALRSQKEAGRVDLLPEASVADSQTPTSSPAHYGWQVSFDDGRIGILFATNLVEAAQKAESTQLGSVSGILRLAKQL